MTSDGFSRQQYDVAKRMIMKDMVVTSNVVTARPCIALAIRSTVNQLAWNTIISL
jgi:hypothetical protein